MTLPDSITRSSQSRQTPTLEPAEPATASPQSRPAPETAADILGALPARAGRRASSKTANAALHVQNVSSHGGRRARMHLEGAAAADGDVTSLMEACLARRPVVHSESSLGGGGRLLRYMPDRDDSRMPRNEAFFTTIPGLLIAALTVHPAVERRTGTTPTADQVASQLADPPIGQLTGIWQAADGQCFALRANQLHRVEASGHWAAVPLPPACDAIAHLCMLGRQADGGVYVRAGELCWRAGNEQMSIAVGPTPEGALLRFDADGRPCMLHAGVLRRCDDDQPGRVVELTRPVAGGPAFESTPAMPVDVLPLAHAAVLVLDDKGRVYEADMRGSGPIVARRLTLPRPMGSEQGWAVTSMGLSTDHSVHLLLEHSDGRRISLQRPAGQAQFQPAFMLDRPLLLMRSEGLQMPADEAMQSRVVLDGHAQLGHLDGVLHYSPSPNQPWERLTLPGGAPLTGVVSLHSGPRGFVDRRPVFALLAAPSRLVELKLPGRTTWLAAHAAPSTPSGGPLAVVPDVVEVRCLPIARFDEDIAQAAVHADRSAVVMAASGRLIKVDADRNSGDVPALEGVVAIAVGLDDALYALSQPGDGSAHVHRLSHDHDRWEAFPVTLPQTSPLPSALRTTRTGQLQLRLGAQWHTVLPAMTGPDRARLPARVAAHASPDDVAVSGTQSGSNARVNRQQASRLRTPDHDAAVSTTLLGTTSTDPLSLRSNARVLAQSGRAQAAALVKVLTDVAGGTARAVAGWTGVGYAPTTQQRRLARFRSEAEQVLSLALEMFDTLPVLAEARIAGAAGPHQPAALSQSQHERLTTLRKTTLAGLLRDLRKIGFREGVLAADFSMADGGCTQRASSTASYRAAELWRRARSAVMRTTVQNSDDMLPHLDRCIAALAGGASLHPQALTAMEHAQLAELREVSHRLKAAGVRLPIRNGRATDASSDPHALRSACLLASLMEYNALLDVDDAAALEAADARQRQSGLRALAKLGLSSWRELEAFDDVVTTFREEVATPGSARQLQLLKSIGLSPGAAPDEMAARMIDVLQDLFNRSTFFTSRVRSAELRGSLGSTQWMDLNPVSVGMGGEAIHALGVERIGDSKDGDAGLVAFFVRHAKATASGTAGIRIDLRPGPGTGAHVYDADPARTLSATWGGAANLSAGGTYQHGVGAAVILSPSTIPEFARLLFDRHDDDTTKLLRAGVNEGAIGLDLFETNANGSLNVNLTLQPLAVRHSYGPRQPVAPNAAPDAAGTDNPRSAVSASLPFSMTAQAGVQWSQMELHLDHAWQEIIGLEFQGRVGLTAEVSSGINLSGALTSVLGRNFARLVNAVTGAGNLQLAGVRVASSDVQLPTDAPLDDTRTGPLLGTASYKRTLDTQAAQPISPQAWDAMRKRLEEIIPESMAELDGMRYPATPGERRDVLLKAIERIQGAQARAIEAGALLEGPALAQQRACAEQATLAEASSLWKGGSPSERAAMVDLLHQLRQEDAAAIQQRARIIPGARVEINMFGRESLDAVVSHAIGHYALGEKMRDVAELRRKIPGLGEVLQRFKDVPNVNQVRFVFEMRPQAIVAINDALEVKQHAQAAAALGLREPAGAMAWRDALVAAQRSPDLYRLAAIAVHNTDENPVTSRVGLPLLNVAATAVSSHQLFEAEIQFRYGLYDRIEGAEVLEAGVRALRQSLDPLQVVGVQALGQRQRANIPSSVPASPRGERPRLKEARDLEFERHLQMGVVPVGPHLRALTRDLTRFEEQTQRTVAQYLAHDALADAVSGAQANVGERINQLLARLAPADDGVTEAAITGSGLHRRLASLQACRDAVHQATDALDKAYDDFRTHMDASRAENRDIAAVQHAFEFLQRAAECDHTLVSEVDVLLRRTAEIYEVQDRELRDMDDRLDDLLPRLDGLGQASELERRAFEDAEQRLVEVRNEALQVLDRHAGGTDAAKAIDAEGKAEAIKTLEDAMKDALQQMAATRDRIAELVSLKDSLCARLADDVGALRDIDEHTLAARSVVMQARDLGAGAHAAIVAMLKELSDDDAPGQDVAGSQITSGQE
ncbi:transducer protein car [Xanthomonas campestris]|uniref:transducer protein car n=1 Tax=Xanthomonas campestris TaxID=339 RepID=UPI002378BD20|nr:transducer protein car [Xanthomonas campestris]WDL18914.1 transducer protein car [Xanthomonas campestris pv. campestris]WDL22998.1 transducer protein car [Xanthomonas campestris pv. campestris]WDL24927.1 transducer protein car [Xanthomonas campestris pv. campestris]WDL31170.1 transducer protein car [Xanthomonas campestris pv. campestris]WDL33104.1 transducer protein car [Xanthomonas campestris pv. campestris]